MLTNHPRLSVVGRSERSFLPYAASRSQVSGDSSLPMGYGHFRGDGIDEWMNPCVCSSSSVWEDVPIPCAHISLAKMCHVNPSACRGWRRVYFLKGGHCWDGDRR